MIESLYHLVLTVADINLSLHFYCDILGMQPITFGDDRKAAQFGQQKINFHKAGNEVKPHASKPTSGSADLCFLTHMDLQPVIDKLTHHKIPIQEGPVQRTGAIGPILSIYIFDPDGNLIEISSSI